MLAQKLRKGLPVPLQRQVKRDPASGVLEGDVSPVVQKQVRCLPVAIRCSLVERRPSFIVLSVGVSPGGQQQLDTSRTQRSSGYSQRSSLPLVTRINVSARRKQKVDGVRRSRVCCVHQGRHAQAAGSVDVGPRSNQVRNHICMTPVSRQLQGRQAITGRVDVHACLQQQDHSLLLALGHCQLQSTVRPLRVGTMGQEHSNDAGTAVHSGQCHWSCAIRVRRVGISSEDQEHLSAEDISAPRCGPQ